jgi:C4-dicarboxylate transporter DctQ subunit
MKRALSWLVRAAEFVAAIMMAAMFATFILQITIRYTARAVWIAEAVPFLDPIHFGWTLEFCLVLWVWIVFFGNAFVVRESDQVTFDVLYNHMRPPLRKWFTVVSGVAIAVGLLWSLEPTWGKFFILRLKKTATLSALFGDWIRMRHIYSVYALFLIVVALRYAWRAWHALRYGVETEPHHYESRTDE